MLVLCANTLSPKWGAKDQTEEGLEPEWGVNYLANYHLLSILSPALRAQPADRDVRVLFATCASYIGGTLDLSTTMAPADKASSASSSTATKTKPKAKKMVNVSTNKSPINGYARSKLALMTFAQAFQKHLDAYKRPDGFPNNARIFLVDPGYSRTPGMRRWLTGGSLWGLLFYLATWPLWWLILKSPEQGAQSFLHAAMEAEYGRGPGGRLIKECREVEVLRREVKDEEVAKGLWEFSDKQVEELEKRGAVRRALEKKEREEAEKEKETEKASGKGKGKEQGSEGVKGKEDGKGREQGKASGSRRSRKAG